MRGARTVELSLGAWVEAVGGLSSGGSETTAPRTSDIIAAINPAHCAPRSVPSGQLALAVDGQGYSRVLQMDAA